MAKETRDSSLLLSAVKVRAYLASRHIFSLRAFEIAYAQAQGRNLNGTESTTPRRVWRGSPIAKSRAWDIASFLGLDSPLMLLPDSESPWESLIYDPEHHNNWLTFYTQEAGAFNLIVFEGDNPTMPSDQLDCHPLKTRFHLELQGDAGDHFLLVLRSSKEFVVLAPVSHEGHTNFCTGNDGLTYPQQGKRFSFDLGAGDGFRELIGVRVKGCLPFAARSPKTGYVTNLAELNRFALQVQMDKALKGKVSVVVYPFFLSN
ncbi:MAG: hypothetical protein RLZZ215_682 [Pseudomonadota bacterium]|jgi:hypothetical protein